jgi:hypothetical protein
MPACLPAHLHACSPACLQDFYLATLKEAVLVANPALAGQVQQALENVAAASAATASAAADCTPAEA